MATGHGKQADGIRYSRRTFLKGVGIGAATATVGAGATVPALSPPPAPPAVPVPAIRVGPRPAPPGTQLMRITVNGLLYEVAVEPRCTLAELLRNSLRLTGTKIGCDRGECGACTVIVDGEAVFACTTLALEGHDRSVMTVEGLTPPGIELSPLQRAFWEAGSVQCGFCTPGMLMSARALLDRNPHPSEEEVRQAIAGNLCRCTGYTKIVEGILRAARS